MAVSMVNLRCEQCNNVFERRLTEHKRNLNKGRASFCSISCSIIYRNHHPTEKHILNSIQQLKNYRIKYGNPRKITELSPFRRMLNGAKCRCVDSGKECLITLEYMKQIFDSQCGRCPYTGWKLLLPKSTKDVIKLTPDRASLDRIDSSKGYIEDNIQFVSWAAQVAKHTFTEEELIHFCKSVAEYRKDA